MKQENDNKKGLNLCPMARVPDVFIPVASRGDEYKDFVRKVKDDNK
jgi:hypothetical protein